MKYCSTGIVLFESLVWGVCLLCVLCEDTAEHGYVVASSASIFLPSVVD